VTRDGDGLTRCKVLVLSAGAITASAVACARPDAALAADEDEVQRVGPWGGMLRAMCVERYARFWRGATCHPSWAEAQ
jgi:hypothetical protein